MEVNASVLHKWEIERSKKIVAIDIDGILNNYPDCWVDFVNDRLAEGDKRLTKLFTHLRSNKFSDLHHVKRVVPYETYRDLKRDYRESGVKENLPVVTGSKEFLQILRENGYIIFIITARPFGEYPGLFRQTINWLNNNGLYCDDIISDKYKHIKILQTCPALMWLVDDNRYICNLVSSWGYRTYLKTNKYNKGRLEAGVRRVNTLRDILIYEKIIDHEELLGYEEG